MMKIATDGSALGNPGPAGWCWFHDESHWRVGGWGNATNNQGELYAILDLLRDTRQLEEDIEIVLDSQYAMNALTKWRFSWKSKGWRTASGGPVKNLEIMKALDAELSSNERNNQVKFTWVRGHNGNPLNEKADVLARSIAKSYANKDITTDEIKFGPGWNEDVQDDFPPELAKEVTHLCLVTDSKATLEVVPSSKSESQLTAIAEPEETLIPVLTATPASGSTITPASGSATAPASGLIATPTSDPKRKPCVPTLNCVPHNQTRDYHQGPYTIREHYLEVPLCHEMPGLFIGDRTSTYPKSVMEGYYQAVEKFTKDSPDPELPQSLQREMQWVSAYQGQTGASESEKNIRDREVDAKWRQALEAKTITIFAREIFRTDNPPTQHLIFFQGGPGCPANRAEDWSQGWFGPALDRFRLVMLDQRGTGNSTPIDDLTLPYLGNAAGFWLRHCRADQIVADAEALREHLGVDQWNVMGQSFGGFIITAYLSRYPHSIRRAFITGGLPALTSPDVFYEYTLRATARRCKQLYTNYPDIENTVRRIAKHLKESPVSLGGEDALTVKRFLSLGMNLGRTPGLETLRNLLENPFIQVNGKTILRNDFLVQTQSHTNYEQNPLYILMHETCAAQPVAGLPNGATRWSAKRMCESVPGFAAALDPSDTTQPYYLTAEHFGPEHCQARGLSRWVELADYLANWDCWPATYNPQTLSEQDVQIWATVYPDDIYVPRPLSLATAQLMRAQVIEQPEWHHDGLRASGGKVLTEMFAAAGL